ERLDRTDGLALLAQPADALAAGADIVRRHYSDGTVDACSIVNAKAGDCAEDCGFCAQSAHFDTGIDTYGFLGPEKVLEAAERAEADGAQRFGIVVAEKGVSKEHRPDEWAEIVEAIRLVRDETDVEVDASLGLLTEEEAEILSAEGLNHYNHNIETSRRYFPEVVGTHSFEDRLKTLRRAKAAGMDLCAGVILGMGESPTDRVDAAIELVRLTGGREVNLAPDEQHLPFEAGADGILTGDYLTTEGQDPGDDIDIMERAGLEPNREVNEFDPEAVKERHRDPAPDTAVGTATSNASTELDD
ncbi:biotin synthase BioB, partial [Halobacteriales archaeon QS_9_68_42]